MKVTYVNEKEMKKSNFTLRKIVVMLTLASSIMLTGCGKGKDLEEIKGKYIMEDMDKLDLSERLIVEKLASYEKAYNDFQAERDNIEKRVALVSETKKLSAIADKLIADKINAAIGADSEISIQNVDNERKVFKDGNNTGIDIPINLNAIMSNKDFIDSNIYGGDGSSRAWDSAIDEFNEKATKLFSSILENVDTDYELDVNKLKVAKEDTSQNVR